jgi:gliding motility-associated-like protein
MKQKFTLKQLSLFLASTLIATACFAQGYGNIEFVQNKGQWDKRVLYMGQVSNGAFFLRRTGFTVSQYNQADYDKLQESMHGVPHDGKSVLSDRVTLRGHAYHVDFVGASAAAQSVPDKALPTYNNYFIGNDPAGWASDCKVYQAIQYQNIYPGIDVRYYTENGVLKYDIIAAAGADLSQIVLKYDGVDGLEVKNKELIVRTSIGDMKESAPYSYQVVNGIRKEVNTRYEVKGNTVRFNIKGYDPKAALVIDPSLVFCSYSGSRVDNWGFTATYGPDGAFFGGGIVFGSGFPTSAGAFQQVFAGGTAADGTAGFDMGIIKLSPNGSNRIYATYVGGRSHNEQPHSLIVDGQGNLVLAGRTHSTDYPLMPNDATSVIGRGGGYDIVVTKISADGTALVASKRIGGTGDDGVNIRPNRSGAQSLLRNYGDDGRSEVILDAAGNVYVASSTQSLSANAADRFPATAGFGPTPRGGFQDAVVMKFDPNLNMTFAGFLGGSQNDAGYVLSLAPNGEIYVAGGTESADFSGITPGTIGPSLAGAIDGYVAVISNDGSSILRATYIGTSGVEQVYGIQFDQNGFPYVMGTTTGTWNVINATYSNPGSKQFIGKLQPDLTAYVYSTCFGNVVDRPNISPTAFLVDRCQNVYVSGWGGNISATAFPFLAGTANNMPVKNAINPPGRSGSTTDGQDFYFFVLQRDATDFLYGGFFGQLNGQFSDHVDGGTSRFDRNGVIYQSICAACGTPGGLPVTAGAWSTNKGGDYCNLGMLKISFDLAGVGGSVGASIGGVPNDTAGCFPLTVQFTDQVLNATEYIWNFGDNGSGPIDQSDPTYSSFNEGPFPRLPDGYTRSHTFNTVGTYRVMMIAIDPNSCNVRDTAYINIKVGDLRADLAATVVKLPPCEAFSYQFNNNSTTLPSRPFADTSFVWDFGDGSPRVVAGLNSVNHSYAAPGTYNVRLVLKDTAYCNNPDSITIQVRVAANVVAAFETPPTGCAPYTAEFNNTSVGGVSFQWDFGDPASGAANTSTDINPTHVYNLPGTYEVVMIATDPNTCNVTDEVRFTIVVNEKPQALFTFTPATPEVNTPVRFTNQSSPSATNFKWLFGDGDSLITTSRADVMHQYNATGTFTACLIVSTPAGCTDTICQPVSAIVVPALDVPNAFTPNSRDANSVVMPRGFGIAKMRFIIWNRWGQKVFETNSRNHGWDGRVKGVLQPMDVYAYTLDVEFSDGTKATKKGDITLIR